MRCDRTLKYIIYVGVVFVIILFVGGVSWKHNEIVPIPQDKLIPLYRTIYDISEPEQRINHTKWHDGETIIDQDNPDIVWFKPKHSSEWTAMATEKLTAELVNEMAKKQPIASAKSSLHNTVGKQKNAQCE